MHVTMLRLSFAYASFTAPLVPASLFDNTSNNSLRVTPFRVRFSQSFERFRFISFFFSVDGTLLLVLLDVRNQRHHLCGLFKRVQKSLQDVFWRRLCWICNTLEKTLFSEKIWHFNSSNWTVFSEKPSFCCRLLIEAVDEMKLFSKKCSSPYLYLKQYS